VRRSWKRKSSILASRRACGTVWRLACALEGNSSGDAALQASQSFKGEWLTPDAEMIREPR
jgi:hypothetical protein